jgi:hypothetical protein
MRGRKPSKFKLKSKDKTFLHKLLRNGQTPLRVARRAQILLGRDSGQHRVVSLGETFEQDPATIWRICERYREFGLKAALYDADRSGRPPVFFQKRTQGARRLGL